MLLEMIYQDQVDEHLPGVFDKQANHSYKTAAMNYARGRQELPNSTPYL